jgi:hypothetical protein
VAHAPHRQFYAVVAGTTVGVLLVKRVSAALFALLGLLAVAQALR